MISAFGIDHGAEIEKAGIPGLSRLGTGIASATHRLGGKAITAGSKTIKSNPRLGRVGQASVGGGGALRKLGAGMMKRPGLTGGAAVAGGTAAVGGAGYAGHRRYGQ